MGMYRRLLIMILILVIGVQCKSVLNQDIKKLIYNKDNASSTQGKAKFGDSTSKPSVKDYIDHFLSRQKREGKVSIRKNRFLKSYDQDNPNSPGLPSSKSLGKNSFRSSAPKTFKNLKPRPNRHIVKRRFLDTDLDIDLDNSLYELQDFSNTYNRLHMNDGVQVKVDETKKEKKVGVKIEKGKNGVNIQLTASKGDKKHQGKADSKLDHKIEVNIAPHKPQGNQSSSEAPLQNDQGQTQVSDSPQGALSGVKLQSGPGANSIRINVQQKHPAAGSGKVKVSVKHAQKSAAGDQAGSDHSSVVLADVHAGNDQSVALTDDQWSSLNVLSDMMPSPEMLRKRVDEMNEEAGHEQSKNHHTDVVVSVEHTASANQHRAGPLDVIRAEDKKNEQLTKMIEELSERAIEKLERTNKAIEHILMTVETDDNDLLADDSDTNSVGITDDHTSDDSDTDSVKITADGSDPISVTIHKDDDDEKTERQNEAVARILLGDVDSSEFSDTAIRVGGDEPLDVGAAVRENERLEHQTQVLSDALTDLELGVNPQLTSTVRREHRFTARILHALQKERDKLKQNEMEDMQNYLEMNERENKPKKIIHHTIRISTNV